MTTNYTKTIRTLLSEIRTCSRSLPKGKCNQIINRCDRLEITIKKYHRNMDTTMEQTHKQIVDRYNAKMAIFNAMMEGRHISLLDSREFAVSQMHTQICSIRKDIAKKALPVTLKDRWVEFGEHGKKCKEYWLEQKETNDGNI